VGMRDELVRELSDIMESSRPVEYRLNDLVGALLEFFSSNDLTVNIEASADGIHWMPVTLGAEPKDMAAARFVRAPQSLPERTDG
jgi:hypothetical protein